MRSWRNWQTRKTKDLVGNSMQVQFLSTAPQKRESQTRDSLFCCSFDSRANCIIACRFTRETTANGDMFFYTKAVGVSTPCREGSACGVSADSWTLLRYSVAMLFTTAHSPKHIISIINFNTFAV